MESLAIGGLATAKATIDRPRRGAQDAQRGVKPYMDRRRQAGIQGIAAREMRNSCARTAESSDRLICFQKRHSQCERPSLDHAVKSRYTRP